MAHEDQAKSQQVRWLRHRRVGLVLILLSTMISLATIGGAAAYVLTPQPQSNTAPASSPLPSPFSN